MMEKGKESVTFVIESLTRVRNSYLTLDEKQVKLCRDLLLHYTDRLEARVNTAPEIPSELRAVISMLDNVSSDLGLLIDVLDEDVKELNTAITQ